MATLCTIADPLVDIVCMCDSLIVGLYNVDLVLSILLYVFVSVYCPFVWLLFYYISYCMCLLSFVSLYVYMYVSCMSGCIVVVNLIVSMCLVCVLYVL